MQFFIIIYMFRTKLQPHLKWNTWQNYETEFSSGLEFPKHLFDSVTRGVLVLNILTDDQHVPLRLSLSCWKYCSENSVPGSAWRFVFALCPSLSFLHYILCVMTLIQRIRFDSVVIYGFRMNFPFSLRFNQPCHLQDTGHRLWDPCRSETFWIHMPAALLCVFWLSEVQQPYFSRILLSSRIPVESV